jgi:putative ABC transport system permease protein
MSGSRLPRWAVRILEGVVRGNVARAGLLGDLEERYAARSRGIRRGLWLTGEVGGVVVRYTREQKRDREGRRMMEQLTQDLRFAARNLARRPGFASLVVVTLALGIGSTTAISSVVNGLLLEPLPYAGADRLVLINQRTPNGFLASVSLPNYRDWKDRTESFDRFSAILPGSARMLGPEGSRVIEVGWVHGGFFETLGVDAALGRTFSASESEPGARPVVVLSHSLWLNEMGGDPDIVGTSIRLFDEPWTVVGVMPPDFVPYGEVLAYLPMGYVTSRIPWDDRGTGSGTEILARLAAGVDVGTAQAELLAVGARIADEVGEETGVGNVMPLRRWYLGDTERQAQLLLAAVALVLLVACANVATLLLVRGESRQGELAVRSALGAGRLRVVRQLLTESLVYGLLAWVAGSMIGVQGLRLLLSVAGDHLPHALVAGIDVDGGVLLFAGLVSLGAALVAGLVQVGLSRHTHLADRLREATRTVGRRGRLRGVMVGAEVTFSVVLLVGAGLLFQSLANLQTVDKGFDGSDVLTLRVQLPGSADSTRAVWIQSMQELREGLRVLPGVRDVAASNHFPLSGNSWEMRYRDEGTPPGDRGESVLLTMVSPEYFDTYGIEVVRGRGFTDADTWDDARVAIVDESLARSRWPGEDPLGRRVTFEQTRTADGAWEDVWRTVVGVTRHVRHYELTSPSRIEVYTPLAQSAAWGFTCYLSVRADGVDPGSLVPGIRARLSEVAPRAALYRIRTMRSVLDGQVGAQRALGEIFGLFSALALALGAVGIFSVVAHTTAQRSGEMGVRLALGGAPAQMTLLMVRDALLPVAAGLVVGVAVSAAMGQALDAVLFEVDPVEPRVVAAATIVLLSVSILASSIPAWAAARIQPTEALRTD